MQETHIIKQNFFKILISLCHREFWPQSFFYLYIKHYKLLSGENFGPAGSISSAGPILQKGSVGGSG